jgi:hypothetical protein
VVLREGNEGVSICEGILIRSGPKRFPFHCVLGDKDAVLLGENAGVGLVGGEESYVDGGTGEQTMCSCVRLQGARSGDWGRLVHSSAREAPILRRSSSEKRTGQGAH